MLLYLDNEAPNVSCVENQSKATDEGKPTAVVKWELPVASDNSGNVPVTCDPESGNNFTIGQTPVTCAAVDGNGNRAVCSFSVNVTGLCMLLHLNVGWACDVEMYLYGR